MIENTQVLQSGEVCLNSDCLTYRQVISGNIVKYGLNRQGDQRYICKTCKKCFCRRKGTIFYRKHTEDDVIISSLTSIAQGSRIVSVARVQGKKADTISRWVKEAGEHSLDLEKSLLSGYQVGASQVDGMWSYVKNKGEKK